MYPIFPNYSNREKCEEEVLSFPPQHQDRQPGYEYMMDPKPIFDYVNYIPSSKLKGKTVLISGGDSGIGRAVAVACAKEGANVAIAYLDERVDAQDTKQYVMKYGVQCILIEVDLRIPEASEFAVAKTMETFNRLDVLINNCAVQYTADSILEISNEQLADTFESNIYSYFYLTKASLPHMEAGSSIINTTSVTAYRGNKQLIDYSATKGAIVAFTKSLSQSLIDQDIRVNGVAPGPIWTPLQPASYPPEDITTFGTDTPMGRAGQPFEVAPTYIYLASDDSRYVSGQILHVNGGEITGS